MKSYLLFLTVLVFGAFAANAQQSTLLCNIQYSVSVTANDLVNRNRSATIDWDIKSIPASANVSIEVMPILDCWNLVNGEQFRPLHLIKINADNLKGKSVLAVNELMCKCLKWRIVVTADDCTQSSEWAYYSFLN